MKNTMKKGFTLIELMVVVIIVGILAAVAVPKMAANRGKAQATEATAACGTIKTALSVMEVEQGTNAVAQLNGAVKDSGLTNYINVADLDGTYYSNECYSIDAGITDSKNFTITVAYGANDAPQVVYDSADGVIETKLTYK